MCIYEIREVGLAFGVYLTHPEMNVWIQEDVFETLKEAKQYIRSQREVTG